MTPTKQNPQTERRKANVTFAEDFSNINAVWRNIKQHITPLLNVHRVPNNFVPKVRATITSQSIQQKEDDTCVMERIVAKLFIILVISNNIIEVSILALLFHRWQNLNRSDIRVECHHECEHLRSTLGRQSVTLYAYSRAICADGSCSFYNFSFCRTIFLPILASLAKSLKFICKIKPRFDRQKKIFSTSITTVVRNIYWRLLYIHLLISPNISFWLKLSNCSCGMKMNFYIGQ